VSNGLHPEVVRGTLWNVTEATIRDVLDRFADAADDGGPNGLDADELQALREEFGEQWDELRKANRDMSAPVDDEPDRGPETVEPQPVETPQPARVMTAEESRDYVWECLARFPRGASLGELVEASGKSRSMVGARLAELKRSGRVGVEGHNRWTRYHAVGRSQSPSRAGARGGPPTTA
jgi:hypothetical protein